MLNNRKEPEALVQQGAEKGRDRVCGEGTRWNNFTDIRFEKFSFVLVRPKAAGNIGAAARALKNMGFSDLRLVEPHGFAWPAAAAMAAHAEDVLRGASVHPDLSQALSGQTLTVGTTCRRGAYRNRARELRDWAGSLATAAVSNRIAVIFGPEDNGLSNQELMLCDQLITIPAAAGYTSLNLAQAVMLVAYELMMALRGLSAGIAPGEESARLARIARAPVGAVQAMLERLERALAEIGFLPAENPERIMFAIREILGRSGLTQRETDILNGIASQIRWFAEDGYHTLALKRRSGRKIR
jgi:tRNA/rRNA methyltransferase